MTLKHSRFCLFLSVFISWLTYADATVNSVATGVNLSRQAHHKTTSTQRHKTKKKADSHFPQHTSKGPNILGRLYSEVDYVRQHPLFSEKSTTHKKRLKQPTRAELLAILREIKTEKQDKGIFYGYKPWLEADYMYNSFDFGSTIGANSTTTKGQVNMGQLGGGVYRLRSGAIASAKALFLSSSAEGDSNVSQGVVTPFTQKGHGYGVLANFMQPYPMGDVMTYFGIFGGQILQNLITYTSNPLNGVLFPGSGSFRANTWFVGPMVTATKSFDDYWRLAVNLAYSYNKTNTSAFVAVFPSAAGTVAAVQPNNALIMTINNFLENATVFYRWGPRWTAYFSGGAMQASNQQFSRPLVSALVPAVTLPALALRDNGYTLGTGIEINEPFGMKHTMIAPNWSYIQWGQTLSTNTFLLTFKVNPKML